MIKFGKNNKRYFGKSVFNSVKLANTKISSILKGLSIHDQERIDALARIDAKEKETEIRRIKA